VAENTERQQQQQQQSGNTGRLPKHSAAVATSRIDVHISRNKSWPGSHIQSIAADAISAELLLLLLSWPSEPCKCRHY